MKAASVRRQIWGRKTARRVRGYTIVEMMTASAIFSLFTLGMVYLQLFSLRQDQLVNSKLGSSDSSRITFEQLARDVRSAKIWQVGTGSLTNFTPIPNGQSQQGNALKVCLNTDTNTYYLYYFDALAFKLMRRHSGASTADVLATGLTNVTPNSMTFTGETYQGTNQYTLTHKGVVRVLMEFAQFQYPLTKVGPGYYYDYYKMEFRLTSHVPDGP